MLTCLWWRKEGRGAAVSYALKGRKGNLERACQWEVSSLLPYSPACDRERGLGISVFYVCVCVNKYYYMCSMPGGGEVGSEEMRVWRGGELWWAWCSGISSTLQPRLLEKWPVSSLYHLLLSFSSHSYYLLTYIFQIHENVYITSDSKQTYKCLFSHYSPSLPLLSLLSSHSSIHLTFIQDGGGECLTCTCALCLWQKDTPHHLHTHTAHLPGEGEEQGEEEGWASGRG